MNQAYNLMRAVLNKEQTTDSTADFLTNKYRGFQYDLSKLIDRIFYESSIEIKTILIELVCQMLRKSYQKNYGNRFVKGFAQRLRYFLQDLTKHQISEGISLCIVRNIEAFKLTGVFGDDYFRILQDLAKKIQQNSNPELNTSKCSNESQNAQKSYSKAFLLKFADVGSRPQTKAIYDTYVEFLKLSNESINLAKSRASEELQNSGQYENDLTNLNGSNDLNLGKGTQNDSRREKLEKIIEQCHSQILSIQEAMRKEMNIYEQNLVLERLDSQYSIQEE